MMFSIEYILYIVNVVIPDANQPKSGTALQVSRDDEGDEDILTKSREGEDFSLRMYRLHVKMLKW